MRIHTVLFITLLVLSITAIADAQQPDSSRNDDISDSLGYTLSDIALIGITPVPIQSLNSFLADHGIDNGGFAADALGGVSTATVALHADIGSWMTEAGFGQMFTNNSTGDVRLSAWSLQLSGGYHLLKFGRFRLTPYLGVGARFNRLNVDEPNAQRFAGFLGDSGVQGFEMSNRVIHAELGTALDYTLPFVSNDLYYMDLLFGLRLGYMQGVSDNGWRRNGQELSGGPAMLPSGPSAWFTMGFRMRPRRVDSTTIAMHRAELAHAEEELGPKWRFGVIGGVNRAWLGENVDPMQQPFPDIWHETRDGMTLGATARYRVLGQLSLHANLLYSSKGGEVRDDSRWWGPLRWYDTVNHSIMYDSMYALTSRYTANYIELPVLISVGISFWDVVALRFTGGVYGAALIGSYLTQRREYSSVALDNAGPEPPTPAEITPDLKPFDAGSVFGLGLDVITDGPIYSLELRGSHGFSDINRSGMPLRNTSGALLFSVWF